jgi:hypothetical protein
MDNNMKTIVPIIALLVVGVDCFPTPSLRDQCLENAATAIFASCGILSGAKNIGNSPGLYDELCLHALIEHQKCYEKSDVHYPVPWTD